MMGFVKLNGKSSEARYPTLLLVLVLNALITCQPTLHYGRHSMMIGVTYLLRPEPKPPPFQSRIPNVAGSRSPEDTVASDRLSWTEVMEGKRSRTHPITDVSFSTKLCHPRLIIRTTGDSPRKARVMRVTISHRDFDIFSCFAV